VSRGGGRAGWTFRAALVPALLLCSAVVAFTQPPPRVGVAFGGGSARGIAHIGVIAWFEEHRIPIDVVAGTSMGGLIGGAFASGMSAAELRRLIEQTDWDLMFGATSFPFKNIRRKEDARSYPARLEFGLKRGIVPPTSLNDGQQVDLLLARIAGAYFGITHFDELPTPFRAVAADLRRSEQVVLDRGSLATAMRATMSLPGIFPPVIAGDRVLVDGGALNNIPADVVRAMGAQVVVAVDVGYLPPDTVDYTLFGLLGQTIDAMMRASTRRALESADIRIAIDVEGFGSLDWRRSGQLINRGYQAAGRASAALLEYQLSEAEYRAWTANRAARRRQELPAPQFIATSGVTPRDAAFVRGLLSRHIGKPFDLPALQSDLSALSGLDRYQGITWELLGPTGAEGLLVRGQEKPYAPPFMMLGVSLENTGSDGFRVQLAGRYLAFDVAGAGSELRIDAVIGSDPSLGFALHRPVFKTKLFVRPVALAERHSFNVVDDGAVVAQYRERRQFIGADLGLELGRHGEATAGIRAGRLDAEVRTGDPGLPGLDGAETLLRAMWVHDTQDSPVVPSRGWRALGTLSHHLAAPDAQGLDRSNDRVTQAELSGSWFQSYRRTHRLFVVASGGTSFDGRPLPINQFTLGLPLRLDAFGVGEERGDHYAVVSGGFLRQIGRLPDFMGGPAFAGLWLENGSAFNSDQDAEVHTHVGAGLILDTLVGPMLVGMGVGLDGGWRSFIGIGRVVR
jgi:NTE family protein